MEKAIVLLSGGIDSVTTLSIASGAYEIHAISFTYGQRHVKELRAAEACAFQFDVKSHEIIHIPKLTGSSLTGDGDIPITEPGPGIPSTFVPARNIIFLAIAANRAVTIGAHNIFIGVNAVDYS